MFEIVFDYGEHYAEDTSNQPNFVSLPGTRTWPARKDPFSTYRSGFEIRTYRLCQRVLVFHHFPAELGTQDCLVKATHFEHEHTELAAYVTAAHSSGYVRKPDGSYFKKSMPRLDLEYSRPQIDTEVRRPDGDSRQNLPVGLDSGRYQWIDLDGEGLSGILTQQGEGWFYKRNTSALPPAGQTVPVAQFAPMEALTAVPASADLSGRCLASISFPCQRQLFFLTGDNYPLGNEALGLYTGADRSRG